MIHQRVFSLVLLAAFYVFSQQINISGKVTETSGVTSIAGAVVKLEKLGFTATTGADGSFALSGVVSIGQSIHQLQPNTLSANIHNGMLSLYVPVRGAGCHYYLHDSRQSGFENTEGVGCGFT